MPTVEVDVGADQREAMAPRRQLRQQLGETDAGNARGDRREGTAVLHRGARLRVEQVKVAGTAAEPDQEDRPGLWRRLPGSGAEQARQSPGEGSGNGSADEGAPARPLAIAA